MKKSILVFTLLANSYFSVAAEIDFGIGSLSHSENSDFKSGVAYLGVSQEVNENFSIRAYYGIGTNESDSGREVDTFINSIEDTDVRSVNYSSGITVDDLYGFDIKGQIPLSESFSVVASVGYQIANWQEKSFLDFEDNVPSTEPMVSFQNGESDC